MVLLARWMVNISPLTNATAVRSEVSRDYTELSSRQSPSQGHKRTMVSAKVQWAQISCRL